MKKFFVVLFFSFFMPLDCIAFNGSFSINLDGEVTSVNDDPSLYNFSDQLLQAVENCSSYEEDFTKVNPELIEAGKTFGGDLSVFIDIQGQQENKCVFDIIMTIGLLGRQIYHCQIDDEQRQTILAAMKDRSNEVITETFESYVLFGEGDNAQKNLIKSTMTDNRFNIEWAKIAQKCKIEHKEFTEEEKNNLKKQFNTLDKDFLKSLHACEETSTSRSVLFFSDNIDIRGWNDGKCVIECNNFILQLPQENLDTLQTWEDIYGVMKDKTLSKYRYERTYMRRDLLFAIDSCSQNDGSKGKQSETIEDITIKTSFDYKKTETGCDLIFGNLLDRGNGEETYTKICQLPESYIQSVHEKYSELLEKYGEKTESLENVGFSFHSSQSNEQTNAADEAIWQEINKYPFCHINP